MKLTTDMQVYDCLKIPELADLVPYFSGRCDGLKKDEEGRTFEDLSKLYSTWNPQSMIYGLNRLIQVGESKKKCIYSVYSDEKVRSDRSLDTVKLISFPAETKNPFIIICAGGGYNCVCSMGEAFPVAAAFNKLGFSAFVLNYRTNSNDPSELFPKPIDDLAAAIKYIISNRELLNIYTDNYVVCGFSAGGNLANLWGLENVGYIHYGLRKPLALFCIYTALNMSHADDCDYSEMLLGKSYTENDLKKYSIEQNISNKYPPCFIVVCKDDDTVPYTQSELLSSVLISSKVPNCLEIHEHGGHGFGDGRGTEAVDWPARAILFLENLPKIE